MSLAFPFCTKRRSILSNTMPTNLSTLVGYTVVFSKHQRSLGCKVCLMKGKFCGYKDCRTGEKFLCTKCISEWEHMERLKQKTYDLIHKIEIAALKKEAQRMDMVYKNTKVFDYEKKSKGSVWDKLGMCKAILDGDRYAPIKK